MITPSEPHQHSTNVNVYPSSVSANLYLSPGKMATIAVSQSHCTRPSSVPSCYAHREGYNLVSAKSHLSPVNTTPTTTNNNTIDNHLSPYFKTSPVYQLPSSPVTGTCNEYYSSDLKDLSKNNEGFIKEEVTVSSPPQSIVADSGREGNIPSPLYQISPQPHNSSSTSTSSSSSSSSSVSTSDSSTSSSSLSISTPSAALIESKQHNSVIEYNNKKPTDFSLFIDFPQLCTKSNGGYYLNLPKDVILPEINNNNKKGQENWNHHEHLIDVIIMIVNRKGQVLHYERHFSSQHNLCLNDDDIHYQLHNWKSKIQDLDRNIWEKHSSKVFNEASRWCRARNALIKVNNENVVPTPAPESISTPTPISDSVVNTNDDIESFDADADANANADGNNDDVILVGEQISSHNSNSIILSKNRIKRNLYDCPVYRIKLDQKWYYVHTFSLPVWYNKLYTQLKSSIYEPLVVHYHNLLRECDPSGDELTRCSSSATTTTTTTACLKKTVPESKLSSLSNNCQSLHTTHTIVPMHTCKSLKYDDNDRIIIEVSRNSSSSSSGGGGNICPHMNSPDSSSSSSSSSLSSSTTRGGGGGGRTLIFNSSPPTSTSSSSSLLSSHMLPPHHHHVHFTHHHHHHPTVAVAGGGGASSSSSGHQIHDEIPVINNNSNSSALPLHHQHLHHHHHHYVRHHSASSNTDDDEDEDDDPTIHSHDTTNKNNSSQPVLIPHHHLHYQNSMMEKSTATIINHQSQAQRKNNVVIDDDGTGWDSTTTNTINNKKDSLTCQSIVNNPPAPPLAQCPGHLDPNHHHHHHHHHHSHPLIHHTSQHSHNLYHPYCRHNDKSTLTEFVAPTSLSTTTTSASLSPSSVKSGSPVVLKTNIIQCQSELSPSIDVNNMTMSEGGVGGGGISSSSSNNSTLLRMNSNNSSSSSGVGESVGTRGESTIESSISDKKYHSFDKYHYDNDNDCNNNSSNNNHTTTTNNNNANTNLIVGESSSYSFGLSQINANNNNNNPCRENVIIHKNPTLESLHGSSSSDTMNRGGDGGGLHQRPLNKDQYDRRILMLQHLLPPEAIQEIRQIWQEMNAHNNTNNNNDNKSDTDVPMTSSKSSSSNQSTVAATAAVCGGGGASPIYHHNSPSLRENFARRVRQVVRQYLGPKAFVADNFNEPQNTETDSSYMKTTKAATAGGGGGGDDNKSQQSLTFLSNNELHQERRTTSPVIIDGRDDNNNHLTSLAPVTPSSTPTSTITNLSSRISTASCSSSIINPNNNNNNTTSSRILSSPSSTMSSLSKSTKWNHSSPTESGAGSSNISSSSGTAHIASSTVISSNTTTTPTTTAITTMNDVVMIEKLSPPCSRVNKLSPLSSCTTHPNHFNETSYTTTNSNNTESIDNCELSKLSNSSQCCMLEWLLSEEADLCILPPSLCQSKDTDKLHHQQQPQQTSLGISPLPSSVYNASISPITTSLNSNTSVGVGDGGGGGGAKTSPIIITTTSTAATSTPTSTEITCSPSHTKMNTTATTDVQLNRQLSLNNTNNSSLITTATISTNNSGNTTTSTTTITTTTTNLLLSNSTINSTFTELRRSSPQPRTESLLVRLLHPTKSHSLGYSDTTTTTTACASASATTATIHDGTSPKLVYSTVLPRPVPDATDSSLSVNNPATVSDVIPSRQSNSRKSDCRLITASLDNLYDTPLVVSTSKRCRSGPATNQSIPFSSASSFSSTSFSSTSPHISPGNKRTRHASQFEEMPNSRKGTVINDYKSNNNNNNNNSDVIPSPPFTSLTQLLMQDFPSITDIMSNSPVSLGSPKYTPAYGGQYDYNNKTMKSYSQESMYDSTTTTNTNATPVTTLRCNNSSTFDNKEFTFLHTDSSCSAGLSSNEKYSNNPDYECIEKSWASSLASSTSESKDKYSPHVMTMMNKPIPPLTVIPTATTPTTPTTTSKSSLHAQSSLCRLLLDAQLGPEEISDAVASVQGSEQNFTSIIRNDMPFNSSLLTDNNHSFEELSTVSSNNSSSSTINSGLASLTSMHNYQSTSVLSSSDYSVIPPVEWNDNQLEQLILEAKSNSNASYLLLLDGGEDRLSSSTIPATTSTIDDNNDNNNASSRSERHPSTSSKVIADEVEMLFEVIQENELESSSHTITAGCGGGGGGDTGNCTSYMSESPCSKRSRFSSSTSISEHQTEIGGGNGDGGGDIGTGTIIVDGDNSYRNEINWQNDAKAVARICEQLQQGLVSNNNNSNNNNHNITTITTTSELSGYSSNNSIINNSSSTSATATSADALSEYGSISRSNNNNYMKMSSKHGYTEISTPLLVTTRTTWSSFPPQTTSTVQRRFSGGSSGGGGVNKAAVAAALASQQAAASQRNQLTNQRLLAEQRKRLIQHQLYNQVAVYSLNSPSNNYNSPYEGGGGTGNIDPYHQGNTFILNENIPHGIESIPVIVTAVPVASNTITNITTATTVTPPLSYVIPSHKSITRRRRSLCLDGSGCGGGGGGGQNFNSGVLSLNATTVHSSTNSASISTASKISGFYHPHHHRPEDLSRCLKEVGPNVRVELSCKIPVNENHHHSSNMNKMPHVYSATSIDSNNNNSNNCTISIGNATKMLQQSSKSLQQHHQQPRNHHLGPTITSTTTTTPGSIFHNPDPIIQSSSSNANNPNSSSKGHPSTSVYCTPSTVVVLVPSAAGAGSSMNSLRMTSRNQISPENQQHLSIVDNSRLVKAELRQALVGRQVIYQNSINNNNNTTTNNNNVIDNNRRGYQCSQVLLPPSNQFTDSLPSSMMNMYHTTSCYTSSSVLGVDQFSNSSILPCSTTTMGTTSTIHRTPPPPPPTTTMTRGVIPSTMRGYDHHNPNQIVSGVQNSMSNVNNNNNNNNCQQWSPTVLPQSVYIRQGSLNLDINTTNSNNNNSSNNNISTSYNVYPSQSIHLIHDDNGGGYTSQGFSTIDKQHHQHHHHHQQQQQHNENKSTIDPFDFLNYNSNNNNSSYFNNTFSYPSVHPLTPSSLSPISVSANTSPCSSTTSQTALLKSPICQPGGGGGGEFLHTSESSISSSSFIMNNHLSNNNSNYYYESNPLGVSYDAVATTIAATSSSCYLSNNHSNYTSTTTAPLPTTTITATPVMPKSSSSSSSLSVAASTNSTTLVYNLTRDPLDFQLSTSTSLGVVNHHLETMMLQSDFRNHQQQQQQQQEENLLPDDLINDVFDLEIMIAAKHQQQQHPNETPFTSSDEFDFLTNATTLEEEEGDNRHPRQHCCYSPTTSIHNTFKMSLSPDTTTSSSTSTALPTSGALSNSVVANQCTVTR